MIQYGKLEMHVHSHSPHDSSLWYICCCEPVPSLDYHAFIFLQCSKGIGLEHAVRAQVATPSLATLSSNAFRAPSWLDHCSPLCTSNCLGKFHCNSFTADTGWPASVISYYTWAFQINCCWILNHRYTILHTHVHLSAVPDYTASTHHHITSHRPELLRMCEQMKALTTREANSSSSHPTGFFPMDIACLNNSVSSASIAAEGRGKDGRVGGSRRGEGGGRREQGGQGGGEGMGVRRNERRRERMERGERGEGKKGGRMERQGGWIGMKLEVKGVWRTDSEQGRMPLLWGA